MKVKREIKISQVIVRPENITRLAEIIFVEYKDSLKGQRSNASFEINLINENGINYSSNDIELLKKENILKITRIVSVNITFFNYEKNLYIFLELSHLGKWNNNIIIKGESEKWTASIEKIIEDEIANWEKQSNWIYRYRWIIKIIMGGIIGYIYKFLLDLFNNNLFFKYFFKIIPLETRPRWMTEYTIYFLKFINYLLLFLFGFFIFSLIYLKIIELYPSVEFRTGPDYSHIENNRRKKLALIFSLIIIPFSISLIVNIIFSRN